RLPAKLKANPELKKNNPDPQPQKRVQMRVQKRVPAKQYTYLCPILPNMYTNLENYTFVTTTNLKSIPFY
ncbi:MAG: hypothetical protein K2G29_10190, partial [Muribaculaceae bacterium]|nr:hypothetical protein [Muribaculaceae bacterium]